MPVQIDGRGGYDSFALTSRPTGVMLLIRRQPITRLSPMINFTLFAPHLTFTQNLGLSPSLCCDALRDAVSRYGYQKGLILHSDHGSQYTSQEYRTMLAGFGSIRQSMGRTHCCFDNARMESFFATLKKELVYRLKCSTMKRDEVRKIVFHWIETYYNRRRRNTANELNLPPLVKRARFADHSFAA